MKKILALVLSVMMLFGCIGSAEVGTISVQANVMGADVVDMLLQAGRDNEGNYTVSAAGYAMQYALDAAAQVNSNALTVKIGDQAFTVSAETLSQVLTAVTSTVAPSVKKEDLAGLKQYIFTGAILKDFASLLPYVMKEANRISSVAANSGMVTMYEDGSMEIKADLNSVLQLVGTYLTAFDADCDEALAALTSTTIWNTIGGPDAETLKAYVDFYAMIFSQVDASMLGVDASVYIVLNANGSAYCNVSVTKGGETASAEVNYDGESVTVAVSVSEGENVIVSYMFTVALDRSALTYAAHITTEYAVFDMYEGIADGIVMYSYNVATDYNTMNVQVAVNTATFELEGSYTLDDTVITFTGAPFMTETGMGYQVAVTSGEETHIYAATLSMTQNGYLIAVTADGAEIANVQLYIGANDVSATLTYMGQVLYTVAAAWDNQNAALNVFNANEEVIFYAACGIKDMTDNSATAYVIVNGIEYDVTCAIAALENGYSATITVAAGMGDEEMQTFATINATATLDAAAAPERIEGVEITAEQLMGLVSAVMAK